MKEDEPFGSKSMCDYATDEVLLPPALAALVDRYGLEEAHRLLDTVASAPTSVRSGVGCGRPDECLHRKVRCRDFACDVELAELLALMNGTGIRTTKLCKDNDGGRGNVRRVLVKVNAEDLPYLLISLDRPAELHDLESLSNRIASGSEPRDGKGFRENRCWHYTIDQGPYLNVTVGIRFPYSDLSEVLKRLRRRLPDLG